TERWERAVAAPLLPRIGRELVAAARRALGTVRRLAALAFVAVLTVAMVPFVVVLAAALALTDAWVALRRGTAPAAPGTGPTVADGGAPAGPRLGQPVSVIIPTWNGRSLLDMSLPPLRAALPAYAGGGEIIAADNRTED